MYVLQVSTVSSLSIPNKCNEIHPISTKTSEGETTHGYQTNLHGHSTQATVDFGTVVAIAIKPVLALYTVSLTYCYD